MRLISTQKKDQLQRVGLEPTSPPQSHPFDDPARPRIAVPCVCKLGWFRSPWETGRVWATLKWHARVCKTFNGEGALAIGPPPLLLPENLFSGSIRVAGLESRVFEPGMDNRGIFGLKM